MKTKVALFVVLLSALFFARSHAGSSDKPSDFRDAPVIPPPWTR